MAKTVGNSFTVELEQFVRDNASVDQVRSLLIQDLHAERDSLIASGQASPVWQRTVNGQQNAPEETLKVGGEILYNFSDISQAAAYALDLARQKSPVASGVYRDAWVLLVDDQIWPHDLEDLPGNVEVTITNPMPYARKIDVGAMKMSVPSGIVEAVRQAVFKKYPDMTIWRKFINLSGSYADVRTPYILKGNAQRKLAKLDMRSSAFRRGQRYLARRKELAAGQPITYPALVLKQEY